MQVDTFDLVILLGKTDIVKYLIQTCLLDLIAVHRHLFHQVGKGVGILTLLNQRTVQIQFVHTVILQFDGRRGEHISEQKTADKTQHEIDCQRNKATAQATATPLWLLLIVVCKDLHSCYIFKLKLFL